MNSEGRILVQTQETYVLIFPSKKRCMVTILLGQASKIKLFESSGRILKQDCQNEYPPL